MTILDASAVVAFLRGEAAEGDVAQLLIGGGCRTTATGLGEIIDQLVRVFGVDEEDITLDLAEIGLLDAIPISGAIGVVAGRLRARRYHRTRSSVSMADCQAAAAAANLGEPLATSDPALLGLCHGEGIGAIALPGSDGSIWAPTTPGQRR